MYQFLKALHIISFICWMAGLLYLPRLFVYHCGTTQGSEMDHTFQTMERKLFWYIMQPSMVATFITGVSLLWILEWAGLKQGYFHGKACCLLGLTGMHFWFLAILRDFSAGRNQRQHTFFRVLNEIPTILMIIIVMLVKLH